MNVEDCIVAVQAILARTLSADEVEMTGRLFAADKSLDEILTTLREVQAAPPEEEAGPAGPLQDEDLPTVRYEPSGDDVRRIP